MAAPTYFGSAASPSDNGTQADAATLTITPPASMTSGDLVIVVCAVQVAPWTSAPTVAVTGGQTWSALVGGTSANDADIGLFWCQFNGTWGANPQFTFASESGTQPVSAIMHVFRPDAAGTWEVDTAYSGSSMASASPQTITGITPNKRDTVSFAAWCQVGTAVTWGSISGTGWAVTGTAQYRNTAGTDISLAFAHNLKGAASATNNVSLTPSTAQTGVKFIIAFNNSLVPTISPNTTDATNFGSDNTPTLEATGTDGNADDVRYQFQIDSLTSFGSQTGSPVVLDSYSETNEDSSGNMASDSNTAMGQAFTASAGKLTSVKFYLKKTGSPTGNATAKLYAATGTVGTNATATGAALATSSTSLDVSTLTTSYALKEFTFTGADQYAMVSGNGYVVAVEFSGGGAGNSLNMGYDGSSPTHAGNLAFKNSSAVWTSDGNSDTAFYIYVGSPLLDKVSGTDSGFANTVTGGDTDPFNSGEKVSFTVQGGDALADGTYYWRARCKDPSGSNTYSSWTTTRSFTISSTFNARANLPILQAVKRAAFY